MKEIISSHVIAVACTAEILTRVASALVSSDDISESDIDTKVTSALSTGNVGETK